jgi:hypothetical protein
MDIASTCSLSTPFLSVAKFDEWLSTAAPGDALEYFHGFLSIDTSPGSSRLPEAQRLELLRVAHHAWLASQRGQVHLVQRRIDENNYSYLAIARPLPKPHSTSLSSFLQKAVVPSPDGIRARQANKPSPLNLAKADQ